MTATVPSPLQALGQLLSGEFDNRQQALADPAWYVHLKLWHRQINLFDSNSLTFFIEQMSVASGNPPYRQRLIRLQSVNGQLTGRYYGLKQPERFQGAATQPQQLAALSLEDIVDLPTCQVNIQAVKDGFTARMPTDHLCSFTYQGRTTYVSLGFDVCVLSTEPEFTVEFTMYDKGIDPTTGQAKWGALLGPFRLLKQTTFT